MPFVKLDCGILNSTLWVDRDMRDMFITAMLMAEPFEVVEPMPQLQVRTPSPTGWSVPPGQYGLVPAAGVGIATRAGLERELGLSVLEKLGSPEPDSRTPDFEGRRLVRVSGGFIVLNFQKYREKDRTGAERQRRYKSRLEEKYETPVTASLPFGVTQAEAEAEGEGEANYRAAVKNQKIGSSNGASSAVHPFAAKTAQRYIECFNAVFGRKLSCTPDIVHRVDKRLKSGYQGWHILAQPILVWSNTPDMVFKRSMLPEWLLRDGKNPRLGQDGVTRGAVDWMERELARLDRTWLDKRLMDIAREYGLEDILKQHRVKERKEEAS